MSKPHKTTKNHYSSCSNSDSAAVQLLFSCSNRAFSIRCGAARGVADLGANTRSEGIHFLLQSLPIPTPWESPATYIIHHHTFILWYTLIYIDIHWYTLYSYIIILQPLKSLFVSGWCSYTSQTGRFLKALGEPLQSYNVTFVEAICYLLNSQALTSQWSRCYRTSTQVRNFWRLHCTYLHIAPASETGRLRTCASRLAACRFSFCMVDARIQRFLTKYKQSTFQCGSFLCVFSVLPTAILRVLTEA